MTSIVRCYLLETSVLHMECVVGIDEVDALVDIQITRRADARLTSQLDLRILGRVRLPRFTLHGFRPPREVLGLALGKLERQVMRVIWQRGDTTVRDVHGLFEERVAYTTLMTTLDRLHKKGLLARRREGRAFVYAPRVTPEQLTRGAAQDLVAGLLDNGSAATAPMLACIVDAVSDHDRALLDELDRLIQEKKQELGKKD